MRRGLFGAHPLLVATDLDGCLLDDATYRFDAARPALEALAARRVPVILASSKTRSEMVPLARALRADWPMIVENGGALLLPERMRPRAATLVDGLWTIVLGTPRERLIEALAGMADEIGVHVRTLADMDDTELARLTGLSAAALGLARQRQYDEPFLLDEPAKLAQLDDAARARGMRIVRGARFFHITGETDKGRALCHLLELEAAEGRRYSTVGLGDSPNDLPLLRTVARAIVVPRPDGTAAPSLRSALSRAERAPAPGPRGWNIAVLAVLRGERLARVAEV